MRKSHSLLQVLLLFRLALAHGDHGHEKVMDLGGEAEYAQRHMAKEHHIDTFDPESFFHIHDLNRNGVLDKDEIEAIYGVHHPYSQKKSADEIAHQAKADHIVNTVLGIYDKNNDGKISVEEFMEKGVKALPNFEGLGAEGHHYDVESEEFHSTPDTQTDESYNHPEDIEHFAAHEDIERQEAIKEAEFQGISVEDAIKIHEEAEASAEARAKERELEEKAQQQKPRPTRPVDPEKLDPAVRFGGAVKEGEAHGEWGTGEKGYKVPQSPSERMRKNVPYKYKFRRNWGDF
ncbi:uncharacterized protein FOMMEDRAFT_136940 [Fomitiporia mediterranea MF3/22]|uniref:uncharacterized protein n=1 Tax=Fomitiporia mediterranea (strain MF3/22) TaxID=694068 RepID=UPI0004407E14|nr:uncharacterized protein FOMMEDRAFT_136940 [Fomitiporia mediterranea MF3/22]EJC98756.1 hypothetical protein FOMMEDRAFT_136940 [Fomitiporia mediterranea MF3/22]